MVRVLIKWTDLFLLLAGCNARSRKILNRKEICYSQEAGGTGRKRTNYEDYTEGDRKSNIGAFDP